MQETSQVLFRFIFGVLWVLYFLVRLYFQRKVQKTGSQYTRVNEKRERIFFLLFALAYLLLPLYFLTPWVDFAHFPLPVWLRWGGGCLACLGIVFFGWTHAVLGKSWTAVLALSSTHVLVTSGPYRYIRHPMYTAFFLIGFGFLFLSANWLPTGIYLGTLVAMYAVRVEAEEKMMLERFGEIYRDYMTKTGRLLPRFTR
jgi:protein-S-isoprenylcysteine O-methyltransferase Ste14